MIKEKNKVFISYRRKDSSYATGHIYEHLVQIFGRDKIFKDVDSIPAAANLREYLNNTILECDVLLAVIGEQWLTITDDNNNRRLENPSDYVKMEIETALRYNIPVIPVLLKNVPMLKEDDLQGKLKKLALCNLVTVRPDPDFHNDVERLIKAIKELKKTGILVGHWRDTSDGDNVFFKQIGDHVVGIYDYDGRNKKIGYYRGYLHKKKYEYQWKWFDNSYEGYGRMTLSEDRKNLSGVWWFGKKSESTTKVSYEYIGNKMPPWLSESDFQKNM